MTPPRHLLAVWNPSYAADAMDEHLAVLLGWAGCPHAAMAMRPYLEALVL